MSEENRAFVENLVKSYGSEQKTTNAKKGGEAKKDPLFSDMLKRGFREEDVVNAMNQCAEDLTQENLFDWMCLYVSEEYLPKGFDPRGKQLEVLGKSKVTVGVDHTHSSLLLMTESVPDKISVDGENALHSIMNVYEKFSKLHLEAAWPDLPGDGDEEEEELAQLREDEILALESMFEDGELVSVKNVALPGGEHHVDRYIINLGKVPQVPGSSLLEFVLISKSQTIGTYPNQSAIVLFWNPALNRHVNMHMMLELSKLATSIKCSPQIYEVWDTARTLLPEIVKKPPVFPFPAQIDSIPSNVTSAGDILSGNGGPTTNERRRGGGRNRGQTNQRRKIRDNGQEMLQSQLDRKKHDTKYQEMLKARAKLPAADAYYDVLQALYENQVVLISGETGCGKTTQIPQFILDDAIESGNGGKVNILCTQPRRLAAIGVASRVCDERCESALGGTVGYQIRLENKTSEKTRLCFVTTGILLRRLQGDPTLEGVTHVLVDEVHERNVDTDFLLAILKTLLRRRPDIKLLLMSATMDASIFCEYYGTRSVLKIPGFVHPVKDVFLGDVVRAIDFPIRDPEKDLARLEKRTDYSVIGALVRYIDHRYKNESGSILIFMSGAAEINRAISSINQACGGSKMQVLPLHGGLSGRDQSRVFARPPRGVRKVVVSTNVAETSITIDDVVFVIDSGKLKEMQYDAVNRMSMLVETPVSRNSARQRRGRAGRVQPGHCFKLYTDTSYENTMAQSQLPEIHRVPLEQLCLQVLALGLGQPQRFMNTLIEPPPSISVSEAVKLLCDVGAARESNSGEVTLTPLGRHLSRLPMDVRIGKMLIYGSLLSCADQVLSIAAALSTRNFFMSPQDKRNEANEAKKRLLGGEGVEVTQSDHICLLYAFEKWNACKSERDRRSFADEFFLSYQSLCEVRDLKRDLARTLEDIGFDARSSAKRAKAGESILSRESVALVKAALCAGLYPNVINVRKPNQKFAETVGGSVAMAPDAQQLRMMIPRTEPDESEPVINPKTGKPYKNDLERVFVHPASINFSQREYPCPWLVYREKVKTSKVYIRDCTVVNPYSILMFGGEIKVQHEQGTLTIDGWITLRAQARVGVLVRELRKLLDQLLEKKIEDPSLDVANTDVLQGIKKLLVGSGFSF